MIIRLLNGPQRRGMSGWIQQNLIVLSVLMPWPFYGDEMGCRPGPQLTSTPKQSRRMGRCPGRDGAGVIWKSKPTHGRETCSDLTGCRRLEDSQLWNHESLSVWSVHEKHMPNSRTWTTKLRLDIDDFRPPSWGWICTPVYGKKASIDKPTPRKDGVYPCHTSPRYWSQLLERCSPNHFAWYSMRKLKWDISSNWPGSDSGHSYTHVSWILVANVLFEMFLCRYNKTLKHEATWVFRHVSNGSSLHVKKTFFGQYKTCIHDMIVTQLVDNNCLLLDSRAHDKGRVSSWTN